MKILISTPSMNGFGVDYTSTVAKTLNDRGNKVDVLQFSAHNKLDELSVTSVPVSRSINKKYGLKLTNYGRWAYNWVLYHRWYKIVLNHLSNNPYDAVLTDRICTSPTVCAANDAGVSSVIITTGPATVRYDPSDESVDKTPSFLSLPLSKKIQYPFIKYIHNWNEQAFTSANEIVALSEFDASITEETFGRKPICVYLPVKLDEYVVDDWKPRVVMMANPRNKRKGLDIFLSVAENFPDIEFKVVGTLHEGIDESVFSSRGNVRYLGWVNNMKKAYENTRVLMIPSRYQEGGPRLVPEAFANGIPIIGSDLGGTPDYIGDGGEIVTEVNSIQEWTSSLEKLLSDREYYRTKSNIAKERSNLFALNSQVSKLESILQSV